MAASLETNKIVGAILTGALIASLSGNLARFIYVPHELEEPVYRVAAPETETMAEATAEAKPLALLLAEAEPAHGAQVAKKCTACHSFEPGGANKVGPNLWSVIGRPVASHAGFAYSEALSSLGGEWTFERLDAFLANPKGYTPGTKMVFAGLTKPEDRAALLLWLREQADSPVPLPEPAAASSAPATGGAVGDAAAPRAEAAEEQSAAAPAPQQAEPARDVAPIGDEAKASGAISTAEVFRHSVLAQVASADPSEGERVARACRACHSFEKDGPHKVGPNLWGIVGRAVASHEDFNYSQSLRDLGAAWTFERLAAYLEDPRGYVAGTKMVYSGVKDPHKLAALLAYLRTLADQPVPPPGG